MEPEGKRVLVHPDDREAAQSEINRLGLPVQESEFMPRGRVYIVDPDAAGQIYPYDR